jgi:hypothetical protein
MGGYGGGRQSDRHGQGIPWSPTAGSGACVSVIRTPPISGATLDFTQITPSICISGPAAMAATLPRELSAMTCLQQDELEELSFDKVIPTCVRSTSSSEHNYPTEHPLTIQTDAYPILEHQEAPRTCVGRSRSCRKAQEASGWSWSCWWSQAPQVKHGQGELMDREGRIRGSRRIGAKEDVQE